MNYELVKAIHIGCAIITITFFTIRWGVSLSTPEVLSRKFFRITPHIVDSLLLLCGILLTTFIQQYPFVDGWLTAKVVALISYIIAGSYALKRAKTFKGKIVAFVVALLSVFYIVSVAITHSATPWVVLIQGT